MRSSGLRASGRAQPPQRCAAAASVAVDGARPLRPRACLDARASTPPLCSGTFLVAPRNGFGAPRPVPGCVSPRGIAVGSSGTEQIYDSPAGLIGGTPMVRVLAGGLVTNEQADKEVEGNFIGRSSHVLACLHSLCQPMHELTCMRSLAWMHACMCYLWDGDCTGIS